MWQIRHFLYVLCIVSVACIPLGCSSGMQRIQPVTSSDLDPNIRDMFEADGLHIQRSSSGNTAVETYTCATRYFLIHFVGEHASAALEVARRADSDYDTVSDWLQFHIQTPLDVSIAAEQPSEIRFRANSRLPGVSQARHGNIRLTPEEASHETWFKQRLAQFVLRLVTHEQPVPWWFSAGLSVYLANQEELSTAFRHYVIQQTSPLGIRTWDVLAGTDGNGEHPAELYLASLSVVLFLVDQYGEQQLKDLLAVYSHDYLQYTFRELLEKQYKSQAALEWEWARYLAGLPISSGG